MTAPTETPKRPAALDDLLGFVEAEMAKPTPTEQAEALAAMSGGALLGHAFELTQDVGRLRAEVDELRRDLCQVWGRNECGQRFPPQAAEDAAARRIAKRRGWDIYPEDSTTDEPEKMAVWRKYAKDNFITVEEHEENRRIEAEDDAKAEPCTLHEYEQAGGPCMRCGAKPERPDPDDMHGACDGFGGSDFE